MSASEAKPAESFRPDPKALEAARKAHDSRPKGTGGGKNVRHKAVVFPSFNVSAMRLSSILGHNGVSLGHTEAILKRLGIVSGSSKNRTGPTEAAVRMRHSCRQREWAHPKRLTDQAYHELSLLVVEISNRVLAGQTAAQITREMGFEVRYISGGDEG